ncbi:ribonuclease T2 [Novosphingobium sp. KCTC 2891]|uniref:ribonuclease T2 n=1 Tax=Novosphingobium sp. KCTC 2891 TaxID=2989730 RepID=UPI002221EAD3|nr:ribonuclease T2 [Novosphingobium sp. KCTC 2891]MCW1382122.1 ribonuclease T2 [Novosphingobium sp. KCTC 2891]
MPPAVDLPAPPVPDGPVRRLPIAGHTLALSWSPEFCRSRRADPAQALQCGGRLGRFGFILHGLWPEGRGRQWPQWCPVRRMPDAATLRRHLCMTPSPALLTHEWAKHGSCMTASPQAYFARADALYARVRYPDMTALARRPGLDAGAVRAAFTRANPWLTPEAIRLLLGRDGALREVHLCLSRRFTPTRCPAANAGPGDQTPVRVTPP